MRPTRLQDARYLQKLIRSYKPDCLVARFGAVNLMMVVGLLMGVHHRVAWHQTLSSQIDDDTTFTRTQVSILRMRKRLVFSMATRLIANSAASREDLMSMFAIAGNKIQVFYNHINDPLCKYSYLKSVERKERRLVCVGQMRPSKGQDVLIRAVAKIKDMPGLNVEFVGAGTQLEDCRKLANELGVGGICCFSGSVPHDQVFGKMASATAAIVPSLNEAFGYVCVEAMSVGTPVIGSRVGGIQEIIREGEDGYLFPAGDADALARVLKRFFSQPDDRLRLGSNARLRFLNVFETKQATSNDADWFEQLVS
jgi:glycosyltransferase involved in cell wall biosynthesis